MSKYVREIDSIQQLRNTPTSDAAAAHVRTPTGQSGVFVPMDADRFGRGDDGAVALQASDGTWWVRSNAQRGHAVDVREFGAVPDSDGTAGSGTDSTNAFQAAVDWAIDNGHALKVPPNASDPSLGYRITQPIVVQGDELIISGVSPRPKIYKTTNETSGLPTTDFGGESIDYDVDAFFIFQHSQGEGARKGIRTENLFLVSTATNRAEYGYFQPYISNFYHTNIKFNETFFGIWGRSNFIGKIERCESFNPQHHIFMESSENISTSLHIDQN